MALPEITHELVQFAAQRLANTDFAEWKKLDKTVRDDYKERARRVLRAERRFYKRHEGSKG